MKLDHVAGVVFDLLEAYCKPESVVIVGVSGGPDSMCLLDVLARFVQKTPLVVVVAHVNHGIRGKAALHDELFVKRAAKRYGFTFEAKRVKLKGSALEEKGRMVRRDFFNVLAEQYAASYILTAHTLNDQIETILFHFVRGSFVGGLAGMASASGKYLKPLLGVTKKDILEYHKKYSIDFCVDAMNDDEAYSRVLIRKQIVPLLEKINPSFAHTVSFNAKMYLELEQYLNQTAADFFKKNKISTTPREKITIPLKNLLAVQRVIQASVLQYAFSLVANGHYALSHAHVSAVLELVARGAGNKVHKAPTVFFEIKMGELGISLLKNPKK